MGKAAFLTVNGSREKGECMKEYSQEAVDAEVSKMQREMQTPNVLICGQTGAGKSSAVNFLFRDEVALVGNSKPCTKDISFYSGTAVNIYDSEGYEIGGEKQAHYRELLFDDFLLRPEKQKIGGVDLVWYAISAAGKRYTDTDIALVKEIAAHYPVCILLTKIDELAEAELNEIYKNLKAEFRNMRIFRLSNVRDEGVQGFCDWDKLVEWSCEMLPSVFRDRFVAGLRASLNEKHKHALLAVAAATTAAAATGASPIPFSDAVLLVPIQVGMIVRILHLYGINLVDGAVASLVSGVGISALGKSAAGSLIKFIPGLGWLVGAIVNATVAGAFTGAIGGALTEVCHKQCKDMLDGKKITFDIEGVFSSQSFLASVKQIMQQKGVK